MKLSVNDVEVECDDVKFLGEVIDSELNMWLQLERRVWWPGNIETVEKHPSSEPKIMTL